MSTACIYCKECHLKCTFILDHPYFFFEELPIKKTCSGNNGGIPATPVWQVGELDVNLKITHVRKI